MKKILTILFAVIFLIQLSFSQNVYANDLPSQKDEVVYGILDLNGSVDNLHVVNILSGGNVIDYGNYSKIKNLTDSKKLEQNNDQITINTKADRLYYQGTLIEKELPWNISIQYLLDGKEIQGADLAGKNGALQIKISVTQNSNVNHVFYDNYALQIMLKLDTKLCSNIKADNATIAEAGRSKQLSYTVLPGKGAQISVSADVNDFEMDEISINGIKMVLDMDIDYDEFTGDISELADAIKALDNGAGDLYNGADQLTDGMKKYVDGMKAYNDGLSKLDHGVDKLNIGAASLDRGLSELTKQNDALVNGAYALQKATFDTVNAQLAAKGLKLPVLTPQNYTKVLSSIPDLAPLKVQLDSVLQFSEGLKSYMGGVSQLSSGASDLSNGVSQLNTSISKITSSANDLYRAGFELNSAMKKLRDGLTTYKNGTHKLKNGTSSIDTEIKDKIDEFMNNTFGNGDKAISFVSDKNTNISEVQFVLKTGIIEKKEIKNTVPMKTKKLSFWQKLLHLFGIK